ncbi:NAD(P)-binding protein [Phanerochaete sordida]|uniref:NAD(P)-binding protein n=1 Tax=Phanerochaete sordida TaxID=48140 RepID=A0A9P3GFZ5_9APHY|nr:NAD(P)-binding protein [Phanerochaete sordida]
MARKILVVGATGRQGGAFVRAASHSSGDFELLALTRNTRAPAATALAALEGVRVVAGDMDDPESVRKVFKRETVGEEGVWGVFLALAFPGLGKDAGREEAHGKLVVDLACEYGVHHLVYSSSERGDERRDEGATLSHLAKVNIEKHIQSRPGLSWTILRPVFFMENFDGLIGRITFSVLRVGLKADTKVQMVAVEDVAQIALSVLRSPETYSGQCIPVVGDILTMQEMEEAYIQGAGHAIPAVPDMLASGIKAMNKGTRMVIQILEDMNADRVDHSVDCEKRIAKCREVYPGMHTFAAWAKAHEAVAAGEQKAGWNGVSLGSLIRGKV